VRFLAHGSSAEARALLATADLGLVSLIPGVIEFAYPSKTATYLSVPLPVLVSVEADSELARTVVDEGIGAWLPSDADGVASVLRALVADRERLAAMRERARDVWSKEFSAAELLPRWNAVLSQASQR
jgi:glycosyltransferase involved in cell wall biosynthesis